MAIRMPIPQDWDGETWRCWAVEWPDSITWNAYLRGFINEPSVGRYWDERTGSVTAAQAIGREIWNRNRPMEESLMSCNETSVGVLEGILAALQDIADKTCCGGGCGSGSRGSGTAAQPPNPFDDDGEPGSFPPGFEDREDWKSHQCNQAEDIINALKADLLGLSGLSYSASTPTGMVGILITILLTPVPFDDLIALLGFLIYTGYNYALLATMAAEIGSNQDELRCILYSADSVETAKSDIEAELTSIADAAFTLEADKVWVMEVIGFMLPTDNLNRLFTDTPTISQDADCSGCTAGECTVPFSGTINVIYGNVISNVDGVVEIQAETTSGWGCETSYQIYFQIEGGDSARLCSYDLVSGTPATCHTANIYWISDAPIGTPDWSSGNVGWAVPQVFTELFTVSSTPHTFRFHLYQFP